MWVVERAVSPTSGDVTPLVVDSETYKPHDYARDFARYLKGAGRSPATARAYVPRLARFLNWCVEHARDPLAVTVVDLSRYRHDLEAMQSSRGARVAAGTVAAHLTAVMEFLRFCGAHGYADAEVIARLTRPRFLHHMPSTFDAGESGQRRFIESPVVQVRVPTRTPGSLTEAQVQELLGLQLHARERFLVECLLGTGGRVGEVLGLRREDMHLLPDSTSLACSVRGAHVHFRPRQDNPNGARVKSGVARVVPVATTFVQAYRDYQYDRQRRGPLAADGDHVFVTLKGATTGLPMTYSNTIQLVKRLGAAAGIPGLHPHLFRHTAATSWLRSGTPRDVVQDLLGHASPTSTAVYLHYTDEDKRAAVNRVAELRHERGHR